MKIYEIGNGEFFGELILVDQETGCEWTRDFIGESDDLEWNDDEERYEMTEEAFDWWLRACRVKQAFDEKTGFDRYEIEAEILSGDFNTDIDIMEIYLEE